MTAAESAPMVPAVAEAAPKSRTQHFNEVILQRASVALAVAITCAFALAVSTPPAPFYFYDSVNHYLTVHQYPVNLPFFHYTMTTTVTGPFYPFYAMYAGTTNLVTAVAGSIIGAPLAGYVLSFILAFIAAMLGTAWIAKLLGIAQGPSLLIGLIYTSSSYYLTNIFGRGAWTEVIATSALPLAIAATYAILVSKAPQPKAVATCVLSVVMWSGSHLITFVYGSIFVLILAATAALAVGRRTLAAQFSARGVVTAAMAVMLGILINAWFLIPQLTYSGQTKAGRGIGQSFHTSQIWTLSNILNPIQSVPAASGTPNLYATVPTLALLWAFAVLTARSLAANFRLRYWLPLFGVLAFYIFLTVTFDQLTFLPESLQIIQFPYRFMTYDTLLVCALAAIAVYSLHQAGRREKRWWGTAGVLVVLIQLGLGVHQVAHSTDTLTAMRGPALAARQGVGAVFYSNGDYAFLSGHLVPDRLISATLPVVMRNASTGVSAVGGYRNSVVAIAVQNSPFVRVESGGTRIGTSAGGLVIIRTGSSGRPIITKSAVPERAAVGEVISVVALVAAGALVWSTAQRRRRAGPRRAPGRHGAR